jgi:uncharacterized membrane protein HdeD (DUF308 family)
MTEPRKPKPSFYRIMAVVFLIIGAVLLWWAATHHEWVYWAFGIMTIVNGLMSGLKSLVPRETPK